MARALKGKDSGSEGPPTEYRHGNIKMLNDDRFKR